MYYLAIIQNDSAQTIYRYQNFDDALAAYHSELAYRGEGRTKTVCAILNDEGTNIKWECWAKESEANEP